MTLPLFLEWVINIYMYNVTRRVYICTCVYVYLPLVQIVFPEKEMPQSTEQDQIEQHTHYDNALEQILSLLKEPV